VPDAAAVVDRGDETDAMRLFVERARSAEPDFGVDPGDGATIAEICRRLDGIPLALELAAARVVSLSPGEILELLDQRFRLLTGGRRTAVERHQTLRATVDWSYSLLGPSEQAVFDRLGVFPASFDGAAARAVAAGDGVEDWDVLDALNGLVNKSMVGTVAATMGSTRYQLLETMRQYARERLDQVGDADRCRRAHAEHYAQFAERMSEAFTTGVDTNRLFALSGLERDNYRAAVTWALDSDAPDDADLALRIAVRLAGSGPERRRGAGLIAHADRLLERAEFSTPELRAGILAGMSQDALYVRGDVAAAEALGRRALAEGPTAGGALAGAYTTLGMCATIRGDHDRALKILADGRRTMQQLGFDTFHHHAYFESLLAGVEANRGDAVASRAHAAEAVRLARESQLPMRLGQALAILARSSYRDDPDVAERALEEVVAMGPEELGDTSMLGIALSLRAECRFAAGDPRSALEFIDQALVAFGDNPFVQSVARTAATGALILAALGEPTTAAVLAGAATEGHHARLLRHTLDERIRTDLDETGEGLRTTLGVDAYESAVVQGVAMSTDDLLRFLRHAVDDALAAAHD